jgi:hypothetical protein
MEGSITAKIAFIPAGSLCEGSGRFLGTKFKFREMAGIAYIFTKVGCNSGIGERALKLACEYLGGYLTTVKCRSSLLEAARPTFHCCDACARRLEGKLAQGDVSNDLLRKFDGTRFGALFRTKVVCNWTLLPLGFPGSLASTCFLLQRAIGWR